MLKRLAVYVGSYKKDLVLACVCVVAECGFELVIPLLMASIIDVGVVNRDAGYILRRSALMAGCAMLALLLGTVYARCAATAARGFGANLRRAEYEKIQAFSFSSLDRFRTSSLVTRLTGDVTIIQDALSTGLRPLIRGPAMMVLGLVMATLLNWKLALVFAVAMPSLACILLYIVYRLRPMYGRMQKALDGVNSVVQENLIAIRLVKAFVRGEYECKKFGEVNAQLKTVSSKAVHYAVLNTPALQATLYASILCILWFGGDMVRTGNMKIGELTGFLSYVLQILNSLMMISSVFLLLTRSTTSVSRIFEVMDEPVDIADGNAPSGHVVRGDIDFDHVYFKYHPDAEAYALSDITLHIEAGETIGILGSTGSGKSSLVQLIPRLYDISAGDLRIDGRSLREYPLVQLRDAIGMVLQKNTLFSGTVRENLMWGNEQATQEELDRVCGIACAKDFIDRMPAGYDTELGQGGSNVSGGQKQRLCIARALLKHPKVLILDDSTSAVDIATEAAIQKALTAELKGSTKIIITQRAGSVEHADRIVILNDGRIDDIGTHTQLLARNGIYQVICNSQKKGAIA